jgi:hypothetical protein
MTDQLRKQLLAGRQFQGELSNVALSPQAGGLSRLVASFRARRQANRNEDLINALAQQKHQQRSRIIGQLPAELRQTAEELPTEFLQSALAKKFESALTPEEVKPLSPEGKRQADVEAGLISPEQAQATQFKVPKFEGESLNQQAKAVEQTASANAEAGNFKLATAQRAEARALRREQGLIDKDVGKLSDKIEKIGFTSLVDSLETAIDIVNQKKGIEGVGVGAFKPDFALSAEGKQLRQAVATVRNSILKARSGGAVTPSEAKRLLEEIGTGKGRTDEQLRNGLRNVVKTFKSKLGNIQSGVRPEALKIFGERGDNPFARLDKLDVSTFEEGNLQNISDEQLLEGF